MLRLGPTRIFLGEEDLRYHLERVYLRQTVEEVEYNTDQSGSDEGDDGDKDKDEDEGTSVDSQDLSPYALSHYKASDSSFTGDPDRWSSQERWQANWRTNANCLSSLTNSVTRETALPPCMELEFPACVDSRALAMVSVTNVKGTATQSSSARSQHKCWSGPPLHSLEANTPTPTSLKSKAQVLRKVAFNTLSTAVKKTRRGSKPSKTDPTGCLSLSFCQQPGDSTDVSVSFPFTSLNLIWEHTAPQRQHQTASPKTTIKLSQPPKILHHNLSVETYPSAWAVILNPLIKILTKAIQEGQIVEAIFMDGAKDTGNSAPWRRGAVRTRNPSWRLLQQHPHLTGTGGSGTTTAAPASDSRHLPEPTPTVESPSSPAVENESNKQAERDRVRNAMSISSLAPASNHVETHSLRRARTSAADANRFPGPSPTVKELHPSVYSLGSTSLIHGRGAQTCDAAFARPLEDPTAMRLLPENATPASSTGGEYCLHPAQPREPHGPTVTHRATNTSFEASFAARVHSDSHTTGPEQRKTTHRQLQAAPPASPAVHVQPFTPVNQSTPHGSHPEPNNNDDPEARFRMEARPIERRLKRMIADELRAAESSSIYDYGLGALRRKPLGEWYREAIRKDE